MQIEIKDVTCGYGNHSVVNSFSTIIDQGEILCFLGPNGVGKTTLFKSIMGLLPLLDGEVLIDSKDSRRISRKKFASLVGYVPQTHSTPFAFKALDVVLMGSTARLNAFSNPSKSDYTKAFEVMGQLGIERFADKIFTELSGGERQMVMIARALMQEPAFIMLDEPTASLDFGNQAKVLKELKTLSNQGIGIAMTTHAPEHAFLCGGRAVLFAPGGHALSGPVKEILTEENLEKAYGLPVAVIEDRWHDRRMIHCTPVI